MDSNTNAINIDTDMLINDILEQYPASAEILMNCGMHCVGCMAAAGETQAEACIVHGLDPDTILDELLSGLSLGV